METTVRENPALEPIPFCLLVPLVRIAEGLGASSDYGSLETATKAYGDVRVAGWLTRVEAQLAERTNKDGPPTAWAEHIFLGREARKRCSFRWEIPRVDQCVHRNLVASLVNPMGDAPTYGAAIHQSEEAGVIAPEVVYRWTAVLPCGPAAGGVAIAGTPGIELAKRLVEHLFLAAWEMSQ
jgi:hypothetical protein